MLGPVPRGCEHGDPHAAHTYLVPLAQGLVGVSDLRTLRNVDARPRRRRQTPPAGDVVGVVVGLQDVGDVKAVLPGYVEAPLGYPTWGL